MAIANYTSKVSAANSVAEIQKLLVAHGARHVLIEYERNGPPSAIAFRIEVSSGASTGELVEFRLPSNVDGVLRAMQDAGLEKRYLTEEQAERVAWRILRDWIRAQLAIIEAGLARLEQVMLPYAVTPNGNTLYEEFRMRGMRALESGE